MGGKVKQTNPKQAQQSFNAADASAQRLNNEAAQNAALGRSYLTSSFGDGKEGSTGTLSRFTDPNSLNISGPTGTWDTMYKNSANKIAQISQQARQTSRANFAARGFGSGSGMEDREATNLGLGQASSTADAYQRAYEGAYGDAFNNFWNANNLKIGQAAGLRSDANTGMASAAQTYNGLYGVAGQGHVVPGAGAAIASGLGVAAGGLLGGWAGRRR